MKNRIISLLLALSFTLGLSACQNSTNNVTENHDETEYTIASASSEPVIASNEPKINDKYDKIRFGETKDILLLDVEWYTPETIDLYLEAMISSYGEENIDIFIEDAEKIKNGEIYVPKSINGKSTAEQNAFSFVSSNPYNNNPLSESLLGDDFQINPDGYYVFNMYPFLWYVGYTDENNEFQARDFFDDNDYYIYSEREFKYIANDIIDFCDDLLEMGLFTQEEYDYYTIKSPLDYYVRVIGLFGENDLEEYQLEDIVIPPIPKPIEDKDNLSILYIGNSLTYYGNLHEQVSTLAKMYGITITNDTVFQGGATLSDTMDQSIEKIKNNSYDYVVLQDMLGAPGFTSDMEKLCYEIRKSSAIPVAFNPAGSSIDGQPDREFHGFLTPKYERVTKVDGAILVNAAEAWIYAYDKHPNLELFLEGDVHPNDAGAYLTACVFLATLLDLQVKDIAEDNKYHGDESIILAQAAWEYVSYYKENGKSPTGVVTVVDGANERVN